MVEHAGVGHPARCRLECRHATVMGRQPQAATGVAADTQGRQPGSHSRRAAAATAARRVRLIVRIERWTVDRIVGQAAAAARWTVGLAQQDRPGRLHARHNDSVELWHKILSFLQSGCRHDPGRLDDILSCKRHTV